MPQAATKLVPIEVVVPIVVEETLKEAIAVALVASEEETAEVLEAASEVATEGASVEAEEAIEGAASPKITMSPIAILMMRRQSERVPHFSSRLLILLDMEVNTITIALVLIITHNNTLIIKAIVTNKAINQVVNKIHHQITNKNNDLENILSSSYQYVDFLFFDLVLTLCDFQITKRGIYVLILDF